LSAPRRLSAGPANGPTANCVSGILTREDGERPHRGRKPTMERPYTGTGNQPTAAAVGRRAPQAQEKSCGQFNGLAGQPSPPPHPRLGAARSLCRPPGPFLPVVQRPWSEGTAPVPRPKHIRKFGFPKAALLEGSRFRRSGGQAWRPPAPWPSPRFDEIQRQGGPAGCAGPQASASHQPRTDCYEGPWTAANRRRRKKKLIEGTIKCVRPADGSGRSASARPLGSPRPQSRKSHGRPKVPVQNRRPSRRPAFSCEFPLDKVHQRLPAAPLTAPKETARPGGLVRPPSLSNLGT